MFRVHQVALLTSFLFAFAMAAVAQDCAVVPNPCAQTHPGPTRQKPYAESRPAARSIAPRQLPAVDEREAARSVEAARVVSESPVPSLVENAKAVAVIPGVKKGAF